MLVRILITLLAAAWALAAPLSGQFDELRHKVVAAAFEPAVAAPGGEITLVLTVEVDPGWHIYSVGEAEGQIPTTFSFDTKGLEVAGKVTEPAPHIEEYDWGGTGIYHEGKPTFRVPVRLTGDRTGKINVRGRVVAQACDAASCIAPASAEFTAALTVRDGEAMSASSSSEGGAAPATADVSRILEGIEELSGLIGDVEDRLIDVESMVERTAPPEVEPPPPAPEWSPANAAVKLLGERARAGQKTRLEVTFETEDKVEIESVDDIFVDFVRLDDGNDDEDIKPRISDIEAVEVKTSEDGKSHELVLELLAKDLAREGDETVELSVSVPLSNEGHSFEKEVSGLHVKIPFGLPSMWAWIVKAAIAALLALLTPCVFPMIPVTVSFFTKQAEQSNSSPLVMPAIYVIGIIVSFVAIGTGFTVAFGAAGAQVLATNGYVQGLFGILFIAFSLSLFGLFTLRPPSFLLAKAGAVQGKGGMGGTLGMGLLFSLTSFTCTAPLVGLILVDAAESGQWQFPIVGMLAFSAVLAFPFFFLALFPRLLSSMPKSGGWMNQVKVTLGFLELAFAMKFLGAMDAYFGWGFFTRSLILWSWVIMFILNGIYLLGLVKFAHDGPRQGAVGIPAGVTAILLILFGLHMQKGAAGETMPAIVESLMPPSLEEEGGEGLGWKNHIKNDPELARARARELGAPLLIDYTGYT